MKPTPAHQPASTGLFANAPLLLALTMLFWGGNAIAGKLAVGEVSPLLLTAIRWLVAGSLLIFFAQGHLRRDWLVVRRHLPYLFLLGAFGFAIFNATFYTALNYTSAINVTILQAAMPMVIFALNFVIFRTRLHWAQALGYTVTLAGVLITAAQGDVERLTGLALNRGDVLMLVATLIYACYSVALRSRPEMHWLSFLAVLVASAAATSIPVAAAEFVAGDTVWPTTWTAWTLILYTAIFPSLVGQAFFARGVELIGSNRASVYLNLVPIFGALLAVALLGEVIETYHATALVLVVGGIAIAQNLTPANR